MIISGREGNFYKKDPQVVSTLGLPYDYKSVMHYRALAFSKDGTPTIIPKQLEALSVMGMLKTRARPECFRIDTVSD